MSETNNKVYLVTGGSGGIGSEICRTIAKYDPSATILIHYHSDEQKALRLKNEIPNSEIFYANQEQFCRSMVE